MLMYPYTKLRMIRPGLARAIVEDGMVVVYHCMDNPRYASKFQPLSSITLIIVYYFCTLVYSITREGTHSSSLLKDGESVDDDGDHRDKGFATMIPLEFELDDGPAIEELLNAYPLGVVVSDLPHSSEEMEDKVAVAQALYKEGFLLIEDEASKAVEENSEDDNNDSIF